jgi:hypothetical protein
MAALARALGLEVEAKSPSFPFRAGDARLLVSGIAATVSSGDCDCPIYGSG